MLLIHLLLSSVFVECTSCDSFLRLFRNYVYYHFTFPKINKRGVGITAGGGGVGKFSKINKRGGQLFGTREYISFYRKVNEIISKASIQCFAKVSNQSINQL